MSAQPYAGLLERLGGGRDRLRYLLNWSESNTRVSTVMKTFTMPDRQTAKDALEQLYKDIPEAAEAISSLLNALEKISERCPPFDGDPYATPSDFGNSEDYAKHVEQMISSYTGDIARAALNSDASTQVGGE